MVWQGLTAFVLLHIVQYGTTYRLPTSVLPEHYKLNIFTHFGSDDTDNFNYEGQVWMKLICVQPATNITLHSKKLKINHGTAYVKQLESAVTTEIGIKKIEQKDKYDFLVIHLNEPLKVNHEYELFLDFNGIVADGLSGFYRSSYVDKTTNRTRWLGATQFEPTYAREAFPCFDEPAMKASFQINVARYNKYNTLSNMPIKETTPVHGKADWSWDHFEESVSMSTYLVAFIVSDFKFREVEKASSVNKNVTFRIWAREDALEQTELAQDVGPKCLAFYEHFFGIPYPLPKQDMVAIPDFSAGAMENWGLITYREVYLLFDANESSTTSQHHVASVVAHELAHQWFGNLVTMKWWTDLWLNEGFATYMASLAVEHLYPHWNSLKEEAVTNLLNVFSFDSLKTSHPVSAPIGNPDEIDQIFDTISYKKGSFIIRMMGMFLGTETLKAGVSQYLRQNAFNNSEQDDLWAALTDVAHKRRTLSKDLSVKTIMDSWTLQTGYPLITVRRNYGNHTADIRQERFLRNSDKPFNASDYCWWIPLTFTTQMEAQFASTEPREWLKCSVDKEYRSTRIRDIDESWVIFNIDVAGLYKVNYDEKNWEMLINTLRSSKYTDIPTLNRVQLLDDAADLAWTAQLHYRVFFNLLQYLSNENEYLPWKAALSNINSLNRQLKKSEYYGQFKRYVKNLLESIYNKVGGLEIDESKSGQLDAIKHQVLIVSWACRMGINDCIKNAKQQFEKWLTSNQTDVNPIQRDLRSVIYCTAIEHGDEHEWNFLWNQYRNSNVAAEKNRILNTLGCTQQIWLLRRYLSMSIRNDSTIRRQDVASVFGAVAGHSIGSYIAKEFFYGHIKTIHEYLSSSRRLSRFLSALAPQLVEHLDLEQFEKFVRDNDKILKPIKQNVDQSLETVKLNVQWQKKHLRTVGKLLNAKEIAE